MIDRMRLLADLKPLLRELETDLRSRCDEAPPVGAALAREYEQARAAGRVGVAFEEWRADLITQVAAAWVLSGVFARFLEDNGLVFPPKIAGPLHGAGDGAGLARARDERDGYFRAHPTHSDRDYLLDVFAGLARLPGAREVFGEHNPVNDWSEWLSGDAAGRLIAFFRKIDADGPGDIRHDFTDPPWDTRFLGDLYQDLSEAARKKYALLQTPAFVEEFILERTLAPAVAEFGLEGFKLIDPACGSGHFLLGGFNRLLERWRHTAPGAGDRELVNRALASVHGVDLNPYAVAITRFRLLLAAMRECGLSRLKDAPDFRFHLACGDSLLHGGRGQGVFDFDELAHHYQGEDLAELRRLLAPGQYHAVTANPPYITVKDKALNQAYRDHYPEVCHMKYSLSVPFLQRIFDLARPGGFTGQITANSFMKREFGKKLIESYLPRVDLTHVIDASGAYLPGHGTPTVILFGRQRRPVAPTIRTVMGIKGEPATPADPARGLVWTAIREQVDRPGNQSPFVSVADTYREKFAKHPWSIGGGGILELKEIIESNSIDLLRNIRKTNGFAVIIAETEVFQRPRDALLRKGVKKELIRHVAQGDGVRDWSINVDESVIYPYSKDVELCSENEIKKPLWRFRTVLYNRPDFSGQTYKEVGRTFWEYHQIPKYQNSVLIKIAYGGISSHNHFSLSTRPCVFRETAPIITFPSDYSENELIRLLGILNSSTACFWFKQVCFPKGGDHIGREGARVRKNIWDERYAFNATNIDTFSLPMFHKSTLAINLNSLMQRLD